MNIQNPSFYGYNPSMASQFPPDFSQNQSPAPYVSTPQRQQIPQQFQAPPQLFQHQQLQLQQSGGLGRPQHGLGQPQPQRPQSAVSQGHAPNTPAHQRQSSTVQANMMQQTPVQSNTPPQTMSRNTGQQQPPSPLDPKAVAREEERVSTLLAINGHLIQEVTNLQAQGKAGSASQQSPTSPTAGGDNTNAGPNSPSDPSKKQVPSQEYADCMRRLQANLAYLAAMADASKKAAGTRPVGPAIMVPPPHLASVHPLYQKLKALFPEASQTTLNKAMAVANAQRAAAVHAQAQG